MYILPLLMVYLFFTDQRFKIPVLFSFRSLRWALTMIEIGHNDQQYGHLVKTKYYMTQPS